MVSYEVYIEINGVQTEVGVIEGNNYSDACFSYSESYMKSNHNPISISLPFQKEPFTSEQTKNYFEGLLPEGFSRRAVAQWLNFDDNDYISILHGLGRECIGAIRVSEPNETIEEHYSKITEKQIKDLAAEGASKSTELVTKSHLSLTGASGKVGLYLDEKKNKWYLPLGLAPSTHIVKQSHIRYDSIVTNEQLSMMAARECGIDVPESFIINQGTGKDFEVLYATKRFDRFINEDSKLIDGLPKPYRLHQEDMCQALGKASLNKYESENDNYAVQLFNIIKKYSTNPIEDQLKLWDRIVFNCLLGNTDAHIKNISLLYGNNLKTIRLAPAYDIISTVIYEDSTREMAFNVGGERNVFSVNRDSFKKLADSVGLNERILLERYDSILDKFEVALDNASKELSSIGFKDAKKIAKRIIKESPYSLIK